jgi:hypothetical protein
MCALKNHMVQRFTLLPTSFTMIFVCHMSSHKLRFGREVILHQPPPENSYFWWNIELPYLLPPELVF